MAKITRFLQKIFAEDATNNGQFGSAQAGTYNITSDPETIQALTAFTNGWNDATMTSENLPPIEEMQALDYIITKQLAYILQEGVVEYNEDTTYYENSIVKKTGTYELYGSLIDDNIGNALPDKVDDSNWKYLLDLSSVSSFSATDITGQSTGTIEGTDYAVFAKGAALFKATISSIFDFIASTFSGKTDTVITASDKITFYDATDSSLPKTDTVQGVLDLVPNIGISQTWTDVTDSRSLATTYTNSTGRPIMISYCGTSVDNNTAKFYINGNIVNTQQNSYGFVSASFFMIIPPSSTYRIEESAGSKNKWWELR